MRIFGILLGAVMLISAGVMLISTGIIMQSVPVQSEVNAEKDNTPDTREASVVDTDTVEWCNSYGGSRRCY